MNFKKILLLILFLGLTVAIAFALYTLFFRGPVEEVPIEEPTNAPVTGLPPAQPGVPVTPGEPTGPTGLPPGVSPIADGGITVVTPVAAVPTTGASLSPSGQLNYYNRSDGKFYRLNPDGTTTSLSNKTFFNVSAAKFDPATGNKAIIEYPDGANVMFDFATGQQVTLPRHWEGFDFNPSGTQIVAKSVGLDPDARFLVVSNPDGTGARAVQELGENQDKVQTAWSPNNEVIATATTGRSFGVDRQEVYLLGQYGENFKSMIVEGLDFRPKWAPGGEQLMYSVAGSLSDWKPQLWIVDAQGDNIGRNRKSISLNTWADKCTFQDKENVYCAVPNELPRGAGLQPAIADGTPDTIYRVNLTTGLQTVVAIPEGSHTISTLMLTPDKKNLYFTDKGSGVLNKIRLEE